ncbi:MAG: VOC family protein [Eubacteriales bacterium]|nr:VOC family protein [Eubacteriales bacterium]
MKQIVKMTNEQEEIMKIKLDHVTVNVKNMRASEHFYGVVLGLEKMETVDMGDHVIRYFRLDGTVRLELIRYLTDSEELHPDVRTKGIYRHFAMEVEDVDALYKKLLLAGCKCLSEPGDVPNLGFRGFLAEDPNGVEVEFLQRYKK